MPAEVWSMVFANNDPKTLVACTLVCKEFNQILQNPVVWDASRKLTFGAGCPPPPPNMTDPQYAELTQGLGCQSCTSDTRSRKIYWALQMRLCVTCYGTHLCSHKDIEWTLLKYSKLRDCLVGFRHEGGRRYLDMRVDLSPRLLAFDRPKVDALIAKFDSVGGEVDKAWYDRHVANVKALTDSLMTHETFFRNRRAEEEASRIASKQALTAYLEQNASQLNPPLSVDDLHSCASFQSVISRPQSATHGTIWTRLAPKLAGERRDLKLQALTTYLEQRASQLDPPLSVDDLHRCASFRRVISRLHAHTHEEIWKRLAIRLNIERTDVVHDPSELDREIRRLESLSDDLLYGGNDDGRLSSIHNDLQISTGLVGLIGSMGPFNVPRADNSMAEESPIDDVVEQQPTTAPQAVMVPNRGADQASSVAIGILNSTAINAPDAEMGPSEGNGGNSRPVIGWERWPATDAYSWDTLHNIQRRHHGNL
ncbi:hypothetical protein MMC18_008284 [Xylographa bjoerkii]|nr:hypothetical protein [Xylographa bjoerkii]